MHSKVNSRTVLPRFAGLWNDLRCDAESSYICKTYVTGYAPPVFKTPPPTGTCIYGWSAYGQFPYAFCHLLMHTLISNYFSVENVCLKYFDSPLLILDEAQEFCRRNYSAHLVSIKTAAEQCMHGEYRRICNSPLQLTSNIINKGV